MRLKEVAKDNLCEAKLSLLSTVKRLQDLSESRKFLCTPLFHLLFDIRDKNKQSYKLLLKRLEQE
jgi:hypothetical protein